MEVPKGKLIAIGGAVNKGTEDDLNLSDSNGSEFFELGILKRLMDELQGEEHRVEVITTASDIPEETGTRYIDAFGRLGYDNIGVIHIKEREDVTNEEYIERIKKAQGILFTGGNQLRLTTILGGTDFLKMLLKRYQDENFMVAGTSAGAMALSNMMIQGSRGDRSETLIKGDVKLSRGFGFIKDVTFDSHFVVRGRYGRLFQAVVSNPVCVGIGLGEDTGLLITEGNHMEAIGTGHIIIVDGQNIGYSNIAAIGDDEPVSIENLSVHVLAKGNGYILSERKFLSVLHDQGDD